MRCAIGCDAHNADLILQVGDFGIWPGRGGQLYLEAGDQALAEAGLRLWFIDGNHEDFEQLLTIRSRRRGGAGYGLT